MYSTLLFLQLLSCTLALEFLSRPEIEQFSECINSGNHRYNYTITKFNQLILQPYETRLLDETDEDKLLLDCYIGSSHNASYAFSDNIEFEDELQGSSLFDQKSIDSILSVGWARNRLLSSGHSATVDSQLRKRQCSALTYNAYPATDTQCEDNDLIHCCDDTCNNYFSPYQSILLENTDASRTLVTNIWPHHDCTGGQQRRVVVSPNSKSACQSRATYSWYGSHQ